ncbi:hypothetical protein H5P28_15660 [Ruficoccus amylovorans]|uniref:Uncharacterized protein n=1 Tax=Ruficoccus amylovorans TaxID=1804625 RepID=A0A842HGQ2_9BACT|nr:hypothetical protein [Ruficoccus amylovorans]MBC2595703.1 hypothetical protein [Ruficoccus amylovorans]
MEHIQKESLSAALLAAADWMTRTQNTDIESADRGRFKYAVNLKTGQQWSSTGWQTSFAVFALLGAYRLGGREKDREAVSRAMDYLKSLQILDARKPACFGAIREETPQTNWSHPRDALSVAWAYLGYYRFSGIQDYLERAVLYADWMLKYACFDDWIAATVRLGEGGIASDETTGSFQSGGILFLMELYEATSDMRYSDAAYRMANYYVKHFIDAQGEITIIIDRIGKNTREWGKDWQQMHRVNDDFGGIALVEAYRVHKREEYLGRASAYFRWLEKHVSADGSFFDPVVEVGSATTAIFLMAYREIAPESEHQAIDSLVDKNFAYLLSIQQKGIGENVDGAFLGMDNRCQFGHGDYVNIRCTSYAMIALSRALGKACFPCSLLDIADFPRS